MDIVTVDFETAYGKHPVTGEVISLSKMTTEEYVRHPEFKIHGVGVKWNARPAVYWRDVWKLRAIPWDKVMMLGQNSMFDAFILHEHFGIHPAFILDTKCMHKLLWPQAPASLQYMATQFGLGSKGHALVNTMHKWELTDSEQAELGVYCQNDCELTWELFVKMKGDVPVEEFKLIDLTTKMFTDPVLEIDHVTLDDHLYEIHNKREELLTSIGLDRDDLLTSLRSNPKFAEMLVAHGVEPPMKKSPTTGKQTYAFAKTDEGMTALLDHPKPEVRVLAEARIGVKSSLEETRTERFIGISQRGPLPVALQIYGAGNTLRWSGLDKQNLQNLPRGGMLRRAITAPPGHDLVVADLGQIEARVLAWLAGQADLLEDFAQKKDVYCEMASRVFQRTITKADALERQLGKALVLGCGYGMGWVRFGNFLASGPLGSDPILFNVEFAKQLGVELYTYDLNGSSGLSIKKTPVMDMEQAARCTSKLKGNDLLAHAVVSKHLIDMYRGLNDCIKDYWRVGERIIRAMHRGQEKEFGVLSTSQDRLHLPNGTSLHYKNLRERQDEDGGTSWVYDGVKGRGKDTQYIYGAKLVENIVQALSRIILAHGMLEIAKHYRVVLTVHDEIVCCVPSEQTGKCLTDCLDWMCIPPDWCTDIPLDADGGIANNYAEAK